MEQVCFSSQVCLRKGEKRGEETDEVCRPMMPAGAKVVPANNDGIREINGWKFYYLGWQPNNFDATTFVIGMVTRDNLKPADRKECLDTDHLGAHKLTAKRMKSDPFFFLQLLLLICNPKRSGIDGDGRMPFFSAATTHTHGYAIMEKGWGGRYGHEFKLVTKQDLVRWVGAPIRHGVRDSSTSSLHRCWLLDNADYNNIIANNMTLTR
jgi:hypothetical protein